MLKKLQNNVALSYYESSFHFSLALLSTHYPYKMGITLRLISNSCCELLNEEVHIKVLA
jgi:hypothetical protein